MMKMKKLKRKILICIISFLFLFLFYFYFYFFLKRKKKLYILYSLTAIFNIHPKLYKVINDLPEEECLELNKLGENYGVKNYCRMIRIIKYIFIYYYEINNNSKVANSLTFEIIFFDIIINK